MPDNYEHYITKCIRASYRRRLPVPILYVILLALCWRHFSLSALLSPDPLENYATLGRAYQEGAEYVHATLTDLSFTGYTLSRFGRTSGYYYYTVRGNECIIVLLSPDTCVEGLPSVEEATIDGRIIDGSKSFDALLASLSADLNWTEDGIRGSVSPYFLSEPDFGTAGNRILFAVLLLTGGYALLCLTLFVLFLFFPLLSPPCRNLARFGNPRKLLWLAENELATLPQLATEDMFITEHFFILASEYGNAVVPIGEIIWIYKYSTLHKFLWHHFSISYTLHISANRRLHIQCPKNTKSDIDGIMDYLAEANHKILVGFSEENRRKVQEIQGKPPRLPGFRHFLKRRA